MLWQWRQRPRAAVGGGLSLCLASRACVKTLSIAAFTLVWTHSVEKVDWQEDWRITPGGLRTGAGPRQGFRRRHGAAAGGAAVDGWFQWQPRRAPMPEVVLGNSGAAGEWRLCHDGSCRTLSEIFGHPIGMNVTTMQRAIHSLDFAGAPLRYNDQQSNTGENSMDRLKGKTAMVVGAGSIGPGWGNGKATAVTFAREGAQVFCVDRNGAAAEETVEDHRGRRRQGDGVHRRRLARRRGRGDGRGLPQGLWPHRRARQQCRHRRDGQRGRGDGSRAGTASSRSISRAPISP